MDVTQPLLRPGGSARTRLLIDDRVVVVDALNGTEPVARATPAYGEGPENLGRRRETPHSVAATPPAELLGRASEIEEIEDALEDGETVVLSAGPGYGKTGLLHHLAQTLPAESPSLYPDGAVLLAGRGRSVEDLLFELFRACYEVPGRRPGTADLRRHLSVVQALVLVDDVAEPVRLGAALADFAPYCRAVLATEAEPIGRGAFAEIVAGFGAVDVVEDDDGDDDDGDDGFDDGFGDGDGFEDGDGVEADLGEDVEDVADVEDSGDEVAAEAEDAAEDTGVEADDEDGLELDADADVEDEPEASVEVGDVELDDDAESAGSIADDDADSETDPENDDEDVESPTQTQTDDENVLNEREDKSKPAEGSSADHD